MEKCKLNVDVKTSNGIYSLSTVLKVLGWLCFTIFIFVMLGNIGELGGGYYDDPRKFFVGLGGTVSSLFIVFAGVLIRGFAVVTENAEISIAIKEEKYEIKASSDNE